MWCVVMYGWRLRRLPVMMITRMPFRLRIASEAQAEGYARLGVSSVSDSSGSGSELVATSGWLLSRKDTDIAVHCTAGTITFTDFCLFVFWPAHRESKLIFNHIQSQAVTASDIGLFLVGFFVCDQLNSQTAMTILITLLLQNLPRERLSFFICWRSQFLSMTAPLLLTVWSGSSIGVWLLESLICWHGRVWVPPLFRCFDFTFLTPT